MISCVAEGYWRLTAMFQFDLLAAFRQVSAGLGEKFLYLPGKEG